MVDPDPGYRPRRAFVEPGSSGPEPTPKSDAAPQPDSAPKPEAGAAGAPAQAGPATPGGEDQPPPLFRDEVPGAAGASAPRARPGEAAEAAGEETRVARPLNFRRRRPPVDEDEGATTVLPRTPGGSRRPPEGVEDEGEPRRRLLGRRGRLALLVGAVAAVVVVGSAIIYAVTSVGTPVVGPSAQSSTGAAGSGTPSADADPLLGEDQLLSTAQAGQVVPGRSWTVALTQRGPGPDTPTTACASDEAGDGAPAAQQQVVRLLSSTGADAPSALHQATSYASPADAAQAYALAAKTFGGCAAAGSYIAKGATVAGIGDQATGLVVNVLTGGKTQWHTIALSRTGRVLDVVDVAQPSKALSVSSVATALAAVTGTQCQAAGGACATSPDVKPGPPPLGGDVPGFLATGDLPPAGKADESWVATPAEAPSADFLGSQCEVADWHSTGATTASSRVYLVASSATFGLNDIVLTMKDASTATSFAAKVRSDWTSCSKRLLTAKVSTPTAVSGVGADGAAVRGWTAAVTQKSIKGSARYRVGIVSSGSKVAYTFLNPLDGGYDLSGPEWDTVAVRAGQRMTQTP